MTTIQLPISKSIANRLLVLLAADGKDVSTFVGEDMPDDVRVMAEALSHQESNFILHLGNSGTAMRFLTAHLAAKEGTHAVLNCCERMKERPIGQLVEALRLLGADIHYVEKEGFPPLEIQGRHLEDHFVDIPQPLSTQFVSALLLIGKRVTTDSSSPYIEMTQRVIANYQAGGYGNLQDIERDWSSAAFFYEHLAIHPEQGPYFFPGLSMQSMQGDKECADMFAKLGIITSEINGGIRIEARGKIEQTPTFCLNDTPDLYPAVAITCHKLGVHPQWTLPDSLRIKESNRLAAVSTLLNLIATDCNTPLPTYADHRLAMALMAADYPVEETDSISKSFPDFLLQLQNIVSNRAQQQIAVSDPGKEKQKANSEGQEQGANTGTAEQPQTADICRLIALRHGNTAPAYSDAIPTLVVDDKGHGKKWALSLGMHTLRSSFVWLTDADITHAGTLKGISPVATGGSGEETSLTSSTQSDALESIQRDKVDTFIYIPSTTEWDSRSVQLLEESLTDVDLAIGTLWMNPAHERPTLLDRLQMIEYAAIQALTCRQAKVGKAVMCAGANMVVRREAWLECEPDIQPWLPSGDDMFILESMKKRGKRIALLPTAAYCTASPSLRTLFRQRMRWAGKSVAYSDSDIIRCGILTMLSNLLVVACPPWAIIKWIADVRLAKKHFALYKQPWTIRLTCDALLLTLIYPWYMLICLIGGIAGPKRW